jgi:hypothetical protein
MNQARVSTWRRAPWQAPRVDTLIGCRGEGGGRPVRKGPRNAMAPRLAWISGRNTDGAQLPINRPVAGDALQVGGWVGGCIGGCMGVWVWGVCVGGVGWGGLTGSSLYAAGWLPGARAPYIADACSAAAGRRMVLLPPLPPLPLLRLGARRGVPCRGPTETVETGWAGLDRPACRAGAADRVRMPPLCCGGDGGAFAGWSGGAGIALQCPGAQDRPSITGRKPKYPPKTVGTRARAQSRPRWCPRGEAP